MQTSNGVKKFLKMILIFLGIFFLFIASYFFVGKVPQAKEIEWGVNFSQKQAELLGLNFKETYLALLDDLKVKNIKLITHWDLIEPKKDQYFFDDLDWQIKIAEEKEAKLLLVIGMKTGRWPECHIPEWANGLSKEEQQKEILEMLEEVVLRYRNSEAIKYWQIENEPFFPFGECPWVDKKFLKREIEQVQSLDNKKRPIVISDSGEGSFWIRAARLGDIVGTTMYKKVWFHQLGIYIHYPFPPTFYWRKAQIIKKLFGKKVICIEFQAEPWGPTLLYTSPLKEQEKTMNLEQFKQNIEFAKKTGLDTFYLWGGEWWFWMKVKQGKPEIWNEAKNLISK
jgi:hypothetical protein